MQHYIIDFVDTATEADINAYLTDCGASVIKTFDAFERVILVECATLPPVSSMVESVINDMDHSNHVRFLTTFPVEYPSLSAENSKTVYVQEQKDWWKVYSGSVVDLDSTSFELPLSGNGATVYLLDSGIKSDHVDFEGADIEYLYSITEDFNDNKGHGTALASVIVGKTCGITNAKLKVVKLFDPDIPTKLSDFLSAMDAIYTDFTTSKAYGIMNCSWAVERNEYIESKMQRLYMAGVQIVVAAGNSGTDIGNVTPAAMPEAIVVGAYNSSLLPCDFSDYTGSSTISLTAGSTNSGKLSGWAPGQDIYVASLVGDYGFADGTSVAAAIHSAILAYNVTLPVFQFDESTNDAWNDASRNNISYFIKKDLLILDDPKYENSPNLISYLITDIKNPYSNAGLQPNLFTAFPVGKLSRALLFNPETIKSVTVNDPLPAGMVMNNHGILSAYVTTPVEGDRVDYFVSITVVDVNDETIDTSLQIAVVNMEPDKIPTDPNAIIPYVLNVACDTGLNACSGDFQCFGYSCPSGSCYCDLKTSQCKCGAIP